MINFLECFTDTIKPSQYAHCRVGGGGGEWGIERVCINEVSHIKKDVQF